MDKKLFKTREDIYKKCPSIFWEVSIFALVIAIGLIALETVVPGLFILTISIIFFPVLFATYMTLYAIKFGGTVTVSGTFGASMAYFSRHNFGCFRVLRCVLHTIIVYFIAVIFLLLVLQPIFESIYGNAFTESFNHFIELYYSDMEAAVNYLDEKNVMALFVDFVRSAAGSLGVIAFIFGIAFNSMNVYLCYNIQGATARFSTAVFNRFLKTKIGEYRKDFWSLNWPLFALLIVGIVGGYFLVMSIDMPFSYALPISTMLGIFLMIPFAPFFIAGMESLFAKYNGDLKQASIDLTNSFLNDLKNNIHISPEDKAKIEELLSRKHLEQDVPQENKDDAFDNQVDDVSFDDPIDNSNNTNEDDNDGTDE